MSGPNSRCRICGEQTTFERVDIVSVEPIVRCILCGTAQAERRPTEAERDSTYRSAYEEGLYDECIARAQAIHIGDAQPSVYYKLFLRLAGFRTPGRRIIEFGCGAGAFGHFARSQGWAYRGFDISTAALEQARSLGLDVTRAAADEPIDIADASVDAFAMWEVIEHLWSVRTSLTTVASSLRPGGLLMLSTPNFASASYRRMIAANEPMSSPPIHLVFFDRESLKAAARAAGLKPLVVFGYRLYRSESLAGVPDMVRRLLRRDAAVTMFGLFRKPARA